jgi:hypothetical protein
MRALFADVPRDKRGRMNFYKFREYVIIIASLFSMFVVDCSPFLCYVNAIEW